VIFRDRNKPKFPFPIGERAIHFSVEHEYAFISVREITNHNLF